MIGPTRPQRQRNQRVRLLFIHTYQQLPLTIRRITKTTGNIVLSAGGVVRGITNWGTFMLPKPARKQGATYREGHYFILRFDSSAKTQHTVRRTLGLDPRMIRYSVVQMGSKLQDIKDIGGKADWPSVSSS